MQQCGVGPAVPWSPLWWWVQPGSLPKSLFCAPSLAPGEGRVRSHCVTGSALGLVVIGGVPWGSYKANTPKVKCPICDPAGTVCTRLMTHCSGKLLQEVSRPKLKVCFFVSATSFPTKVNVFCHNFHHGAAV